MPRGVDHLVLCVNDLKKAYDVYTALGFTMTPQAQHPFGTGNILAQLNGCFLEVLGVTKPEDITEHDGDAFSFGAFNRDFLNRREGMSMLVLDSDDETADRAEFEAKQLHLHAPFEFQRQAKQPDGSEATVGFSLTFLSAAALPGMGFFTCKQWRPDLFWKPDYQSHANGAETVAEVLIVSPDRAGAIAFLSAFADAPAVETSPGTTHVTTPRGDLSILSPDAFEARFPGTFPVNPGTAPFFAGYAIKVADPAATADVWRRNGLAVREDSDGPWIEPGAGLGCVIAATA